MGLSLDKVTQSSVPHGLKHSQGWDIYNFSFRVKNFYLYNLNPPSFSLKSFPLALILQATIKSCSSFFLQSPFRNAAVRSPLNLLFSRLNRSMNGPQILIQAQVRTGAFGKGSSRDKLQELLLFT